jgi:putative membrane protein insertion efficiency factor
MIKRSLIAVINFYRNYLSGYKLRCCRYYPSCSEYAVEAIEKKGALKGLLLSAFRIIRCNPFSKGGYDPVK